MTMQEAIRQRMIDLMQENGLNTSELARRAGLTQSTVNGILKGSVKNPTVQSIYLIAGAMGLSLDQFFVSRYFQNIDIENLKRKQPLE
ncbi:helix-turn-helix transcriptional regulator [Lysinibacillus sp. HST-98]|uniref:helix-turn-helix domain-containing protein n=1 Tax=Lysinibacillus sp. HST-98 TaxID=2800419 RepID=UPI0019253EE5|nr:helix-turn-helix transcriptional regulator [Lysinibacillus sp. HST-98]MBL3731658.1 helix-turn-helix transcriptional regulator [Lysinibacillus sp. HST-98]